MRWYFARRPEERAKHAAVVARLGSALSDPAPGIAAMSRVGVIKGRWTLFRIRFWHWVGRPVRAQRIILRQLERELGL